MSGIKKKFYDASKAGLVSGVKCNSKATPCDKEKVKIVYG